MTTISVFKLILISLICAFCIHYHHIHAHHDAKRALIFPATFVIQLTSCIAVPSDIPKRSFALNLCMQANFMAPMNISDYYITTVQASQTRSISNHRNLIEFNRKIFYNYVINFMEEYDLNGKDCLLKLICEISEVPFSRKHRHNLLENIIHFLFTPCAEYTYQNNNTIIEDEYCEAEVYGIRNKQCHLKYETCDISVLSFFTSKFYE